MTVVERTVTVAPPEGLHARPAAQFVHAAKEFEAEIVVVCGEREASAKSQLRVMQLGAKHGAQILIRADGPDAEEAVAALSEIIGTPA